MSLRKIAKVFLVQILNLFKFSQTTLAIVLFFGNILLTIAFIAEVFFGGDFSAFIPWLDRLGGKSIHIDEGSIISFYIWASLIVYVLASVIGYATKKRIRFSRKHFLITLLLVIVALLVFNVMFIAPELRLEAGVSISEFNFGLAFFSLITICAIAWAFLMSYLVDKSVRVITLYFEKDRREIMWFLNEIS